MHGLDHYFNNTMIITNNLLFIARIFLSLELLYSTSIPPPPPAPTRQ
jgi:hypothetical protein